MNFNNFFGNNRVHPSRLGFQFYLRAYPVSYIVNKEHLNSTGKVLLPSSTLEALLMVNNPGPMIFQVSNESNGAKLCCGVLEFVSMEGHINMPNWMMTKLGIAKGGQNVVVTLKSLKNATFVKFQPLSLNFLEIENPKVVLERALRNYNCLNIDDEIEIDYCDTIYQLKVIDAKPEKSVCITDCDMEVDFEEPPGYQEYQDNLKMERMSLKLQDKINSFLESESSMSSEFKSFQGTSTRADGKKRKKKANNQNQLLTTAKTKSTDVQSQTPLLSVPLDECFPDHDWKLGTVQFDNFFYRRVEAINQKKLSESKTENAQNNDHSKHDDKNSNTNDNKKDEDNLFKGAPGRLM